MTVKGWIKEEKEKEIKIGHRKARDDGESMEISEMKRRENSILKS